MLVKSKGKSNSCSYSFDLLLLLYPLNTLRDWTLAGMLDIALSSAIRSPHVEESLCLLILFNVGSFTFFFFLCVFLVVVVSVVFLVLLVFVSVVVVFLVFFVFVSVSVRSYTLSIFFCHEYTKSICPLLLISLMLTTIPPKCVFKDARIQMQ